MKKKGRIAFTEDIQPNFCRLPFLLVVHVKADMVAQTSCSWNSDLPFTKIYNIRNLTLSRANRWEELPLNAICSNIIIS